MSEHKSLYTKFKSLFDTQKVGKGVKKTPKLPLTLGNFFSYVKLHFSDIFKVNMVLIIGNFPVFFFFFALTGKLNETAAAPSSYLFSQLYGAALHQQGAWTPAGLALYGVHGIQAELSIMTTATYVCFGLTALLLFTFGFVSVGTTYILRNLMKHEPIFFMNDMFYAIRRNWKQALILCAIDLGFLALFGYNLMIGYMNMGNTGSDMVFVANILLFFLYTMARFYLYQMLITFDLSIFKIIKNAVIFSMLGFKRNILAFIGQALLLTILWVMSNSILMPVSLTAFLFIVPGLCAYMSVYASWPEIKRIMIDPYYKTEPEERTEPIFRDMG